MPKLIQLRDVPERLHRELVRRAQRAGLTLSDYVQHVLEREVSRPPVPDVRERIATRAPVDLGMPAAELLRAERSGRRHS